MEQASRSERLLAFIVLVAVASGCQKESALKGPDRAALVQQAIDPTPPPGLGIDSTRARSTLTVLSPDTLELRRGHPAMVTLEVQYTITKPALVNRAVLQFWNDAVGVIDTATLPVTSEGNGRWTLTKPLSIGPLVQFSAHCPAGDTPPFLWGLPAQPTSATPAIITVTPTHVPEEIPDDPNPAHVGIPVTLWGNGLGPDCTVGARIDGRAITLDAQPRGANGLFVFVKRSDLGPYPIYSRWFDLKFILRGPQAGTESVARIPVAAED